MKVAFQFLGLLVVTSATIAEILPPLHVAPPAQSGTLRIWANAAMAPVIERWRQEFMRDRSAVRIEVKPCGSDVAMAGLYTGRADIAFLGREATASELKAYEWVFRHPPFRVEVMNGSLSRGGRSPALLVCVHAENPLTQITLAELDAICAAAPGRGAPRPIRAWNELGLTAEWDRPIRVYGFDTESGTGRFFREAVLRGSRHLNWEALVEFADTEPLTPPTHDAASKIADALARDRFGLAVTTGVIGDPRIKVLPLAAGPEMPPVPANRATVINRTYPLARVAFGYVSRPPGKPLDRLVREFLQHALSAEGRRAIDASDYLPLAEATAREQRQRLE